MNTKKMCAFICVLALTLTATVAMAYNIKISTGGISYAGRSLGGSMEYTENGKLVGSARNYGSEFAYFDARNKQIGSVRKIGNEWQFRDGNSKIIGYVSELGGRHIYKGGNSIIIGYAEKLGSRTYYKAGNNIQIGDADTDSMPFRPIPLEVYLKKLKNDKLDSVCLIRATKVEPDGEAMKSGLQVGDFIITFEGKDWNQFSMNRKSYKETLSLFQEKLKDARPPEGIAMIVYRPAQGERNEARGQIVKLSPMPPTNRRYTYTSSEESPYYTKAGSKKYAAQMKAIYQKWLEENQ